MGLLYFLFLPGPVLESCTFLRIWNAPTKDKDWLNGYKKKKRPLYMLSTRDPPQNKGHIETESEGLEKDIPCK